MIGENFEFYSFQMPKNVFKLSAIVGENVEICLPKIAKIAFKFSTMIGNFFEFYSSQMSKSVFKFQNYCLLTLSDYCVERMRKSNPKNFPLPNLYFP